MRIRWLRRAILSLNTEAEYIAKDDPAESERVVTRIVEAVERLKQYPAIGRPGRVLGTRELVVSNTPYIVPYRVRGSVIEVLRVFHGGRRWPETFE